MSPGTKVGARRWPNEVNHPGCWGVPWKGTLLAVDDPRAWEGSIALGPGKPSKKETTAHVMRCQPQGLTQNTVPVLWYFDTGPKVYWEEPSRLRPYSEDLAAWRKAQSEAWAAQSPQNLAA